MAYQALFIWNSGKQDLRVLENLSPRYYLPIFDHSTMLGAQFDVMFLSDMKISATSWFDPPLMERAEFELRGRTAQLALYRQIS